MPDWNPAEIIGISPKPLAFSLYRELITDFIWPESRKAIGYKDVNYQPGIYSFAGKPYVDVRMSFNTFLPANLSSQTSEKLVNYYIDKLTNNPRFHDKIEFKIAYTCYTPFFDEKDLIQNNFSKLQIEELKKTLLILTDKNIKEEFSKIDYEISLTDKLNNKRKKIEISDLPLPVKIMQLIHDCKYYGTLPFSKLARFAFIGSKIMNSLLENKVISTQEYQFFFNSIDSVAKEFLVSLSKLKNKEISKKEFLDYFGHLRSGTYDINSPNYFESFDEYVDLKNFNFNEDKEKITFEFSKKTKNKINDSLKQSGFTCSADQLITFSQKSLQAREKVKFEFTKNLNLILSYVEKYLKSLGISKEDAAYLEITDIVIDSYKSHDLDETKKLNRKIAINKSKFKITKAIKLPPVIYMERNIDYFHMFDDLPNYITSKKVSAEILLITNDIDTSELNNKIILIENADPGYDWIFSHNIKGLITKYGGVASHMSIRAAEFGLPAAIGAGEAIFNYVKNSHKIELNCASHQIKRFI